MSDTYQETPRLPLRVQNYCIVDAEGYFVANHARVYEDYIISACNSYQPMRDALKAAIAGESGWIEKAQAALTESPEQ